MRILALAMLAIATVSLAPQARAQTYDPRYPVCMRQIVNFGGERYECAYDTMEQCAQRASGLAGQCLMNPYYGGERGRRGRRGY